MKPAPGRVDSFGVKRIACIAVSSARWYFYVTFQVLTLRIIKCYRLKHGENHRVTHGVNLQLTRFVFASSKNIKFVFGASTASLQRKHEFTMHQSIPPAPSPPPPRATAGNLPALLVPGVGHLRILHCPGAGHLPTPGPFPSLTRTRFPIRIWVEYNYTEGFIGKKADWLICQGQE